MSDRDTKGYSNRSLLSDIVDFARYTEKEQECIRLYQQYFAKYMKLQVMLYGSAEERVRRDSPEFDNLLREYESVDKELIKLENSKELVHVLEIEKEQLRAELDRLGKEAREKERQRNAELVKEFYKKQEALRADNLESKSILDEIRKLFGWNNGKLTDSQALIEKTAFYCIKHFRKENCILGSSKITCADTIAFVSFLIRAFVITSTENRKTAELFSDDYITSMVKVINHYYLPNDTIEAFLDNRFAFYDSVFVSKADMNDGVAALLEEFEYIIKTDIINKGYVPYSSQSPLPILSFDEDVAFQIEVKAFYNEFIDKMQDFVKKVQDNIESLYMEKELLSPIEFYKEALSKLHNFAEYEGLCDKGLIGIPELIPIGQKTVLSFLNDTYLNMEFRNNPAQFYYVVASFCLQCGIIFAAKWRDDFSALNDNYVERVIADGPWDHVEMLFTEDLQMDKDEFNDLCKNVYDEWLDLHEPYWELEDPREYTFNALLAVYQLGISIILSVGASPVVPQRNKQSESTIRQQYTTQRSEPLRGSFTANDTTQRTQTQYISKETIQTHIQAKKTSEKKEKSIRVALVVFAVVIILALIINSVVKSNQNDKLRNFATESMKVDYINVYADIVSMEPEYFVYSGYGSSQYISEIVCKCKTVEGKNIWILVDTWEYPGGSLISENYEPQYYSKANPKRIKGDVRTARGVMQELEDEIGNVFVLNVTEEI